MFFTNKWLTTHIERKHHPNESKSNVLEKLKINNVNHITRRTLVIVPSFSIKTLLMLKILSRIPNRDMYIINNSPFDQYSKNKIKIKDIGEEIKPLNEYVNAIIVVDDILVTSNSKCID